MPNRRSILRPAIHATTPPDVPEVRQSSPDERPPPRPEPDPIPEHIRRMLEAAYT
jgi:hypothetical protein